MASFQKRGKTWQYTVSRTINGKSHPLRKGGFKTKKEAQIAAAEVEADLQKGIVTKATDITLPQYFREWIDIYKKDISHVTRKRYIDTLRTLEAAFKGNPLQTITKRQYQAFLNDYGVGRARETTRKLNIHVRACVREAMDEGIIRVDFTRGAIITGDVPAKRPEEKHLNYEDSKKLLAELYRRLPRANGYYALLLALTSGMRFGEIVGLTRNDFDFVRNEISVNKTWDYKNGVGFGEVKSVTSNRVIQMDTKTMAVFRQMFENTPNNIHRLVFFSPQSKNKTISNNAVNKLLKSVLDDLGIEPITLHGLRHTHASVLLYKKVSIYYVSERLGHSDIETTMRHYAHVIKEMRENDMKATIDVMGRMYV